MANNTIIRPKDRNEWLEYRKTGIGSSEIATIVGLNPWETPYQLWRRKKGLDEAKTENFAMKAGHYLEDAVSQFWADETGYGSRLAFRSRKHTEYAGKQFSEIFTDFCFKHE